MIRKIEDHEFSNIFWDIHRLGKDVDLRKKHEREFKEVFPHLVRTAVEETNKLVRYVIYLYDKNSPLRTHIRDVRDRREYAASLANFGTNNNYDPKKRDWIIKGNDTKIVTAVFYFIKYTDDMKYAQLVSNETLFWNYYNQLIAPLPDKPSKTDIESRRTLRTEIKNIQEDISVLEHEIYGGDKEVAEVVKQVRKMMTTPEAMAI